MKINWFLIQLICPLELFHHSKSPEYLEKLALLCPSNVQSLWIICYHNFSLSSKQDSHILEILPTLKNYSITSRRLVTSQGPLQTRLSSFLGAKLHFPEAISSAESVLPATGGLGKPEDARELPGKRAHGRGCLTRAPRNGSEAGRGAGGRAPEGGRPAGRGGQAHSVPLDPFLQLSKGNGQEPRPRSGSAPGQLPRRGAGPDPGCLHCWAALSVDLQKDEGRDAGTIIQEAPLRSIIFSLEVLPSWALDPGEWGRKKCLPATLWSTFLL